MKKLVYYFESNINTVTGFYLDIIVEALRGIGLEVKPLKECSPSQLWKLTRTDSWFLTTNHKDITRLLLYGFRHFIHWFQGLVPEEDYMRTHSALRRKAFRLLDHNSMRHSNFSFFVSQQQLDYLSTIHSIAVAHCHIMPCFNQQLKPEHFFTPGKYDHNTFCYVGSATDAWQCFDQIVKLYAHIEQNHSGCSLKVLTPDVDIARQAAIRHHLKHYTVGHVPQTDVAREISDCKFGFLIREDHIVNNVATPTKLSNYLASGVIPVISHSLQACREMTQQHPFICVVDNLDAAAAIEPWLTAAIQPQDVLQASRQIFDTYYSRQKHIEAITRKIIDSRLFNDI